MSTAMTPEGQGLLDCSSSCIPEQWPVPSPLSLISTTKSIAKILWTSGRTAPEGGARQQLGSSAPVVQSLSLPDCRRVPPAGAAGLLPKLRRQSRGGVMEEKGIVLPELSCRTAPELPPPDCRRISGGVLRELKCRRSLPAAPVGVLQELNC
ncbi:unnamed protein product [Boreogadus saida]